MIFWWLFFHIFIIYIQILWTHMTLNDMFLFLPSYTTYMCHCDSVFVIFIVINIFFKLKYRYWWNVAWTVYLVVVEDVKNLISFIQSLINIIACLIAISHGDVLLCFGDHLWIMSLSHILIHTSIFVDAKIICILFLFIIPSINYQSTRNLFFSYLISS